MSPWARGIPQRTSLLGVVFLSLRRIRVAAAALVAAVALVAAACSSGGSQPAGSTGGGSGGSGGTGDQAGQSRLQVVLSRGKLICGVNGQLPGFSYLDPSGQMTGFDADFCRAIAAALFDDPNAVEFRPLSAQERFTAVQSGEVDVLIRNTTWTLGRDTVNGMEFLPTTFYDGGGVMVRKDRNVKSLADLDGATICVLSGTTNEMVLTDRMRALGASFTPKTFEDADQLYATYESGGCDAVTSDKSQLAGRRAVLSDPDNHVILDEMLSKEPLGPAVKNNDSTWFDVVKWIVFATIQAEEFGINSQNVDQFKNSDNPDIRRFLGVEGELGKGLGISNDFAYRVIKHVGNYGEIYERNLGPDTPFKLERGLNELWTNGGLLYSPPFR
ncbi:periplasmic component of amino acid ABC-type transporter/signal transduction system [Thermaerobacter subterraneus DSM 13965]|uniref:Periplasmic component of amino acid ABC-type transporter/signal transduction system n=1 Tax=Thermaerobacter subterraneus DSM 13965 TaxID=867903 RepID=K6P3P1_9FIRM|nr:periplasmic component of amino acid ABC-type transporter/signal transduction system [Thermaerobacter subterraneus DSM 13965]